MLQQTMMDDVTLHALLYDEKNLMRHGRGVAYVGASGEMYQLIPSYDVSEFLRTYNAINTQSEHSKDC